MFRVALASVLGNRIRLALTSLAIVLGVAFVSGTLVLTDSIDRAFGNLLSEVNVGTDLYINATSEVDAGLFGDQPGQGPTIEASVLDDVLAVEGVAEATPFVEGIAQVVGKDGEPVGGMGPPTFGFSWSGPDEAGPLTLRDGRPASGSTEATLDAATVETTGYELGDRVPVRLRDGIREFTLVGITGFGEEDNLLGATIVTFDMATAQEVFDRVGTFDSIAVAGTGDVSREQLRDRVAGALASAGVEVVTVEEEQAEEQDAVRQGLSFLNIALLSFAGIAVFVGIFLIVNTFSIIVAQRTREFGLLRAVGASSRQVRMAVTVEALVVGVLSGVVGLVAGIGLSEVMRAIFDAIGFGFPDGGLVIQVRTVVAAMVIGVFVTLFASILPARRASRISPMDALRAHESTEPERVGHRRTVVGVLVLVGGVAAIAAGLSGIGAQPAAMVGGGAAGTFLGVTLLAPYLAGPAAALLGAVPARLGLPGRLARNNSDGSPRRTAATASALMIGVALVTFVSIFAASSAASVNALFADQLGADFLVTATSFGPGGIPQGVSDQLDARPEVGAVTPGRSVIVEVDDEVVTIAGVRGEAVDDLMSLGLQAGGLEALSSGLLVHADRAVADGLVVGDEVTMTFPNGDEVLPVVGIFTNQELVGSPWVTDIALLESLGAEGTDGIVLADAAPGVAVEEARAAVEEVIAAFPGVQVQDQTEFTISLREQVDQLLNVMIGLLGLALVIALIGIVNTLALSVFERTREIGLLRAVGMTRRQVRSMIRWEAVIVSVFGAVLGVAVGAIFGWALVTASAESGLGVLEFPAVRLVAYVVGAALAGVLAALLPARRAARLDVLQAVTTE